MQGCLTWQVNRENAKGVLKITILKNKHVNGILWISVVILLCVSLFTMVSSYFNTKEINFASSQCYKYGGEVQLEIHNNLTSEYSFECKQKK